MSLKHMHVGSAAISKEMLYILKIVFNEGFRKKNCTVLVLIMHNEYAWGFSISAAG